MAEDKKISGLLELSYRTLEELTGNNTPQVLVPVCIENSNYKVDLKTLFGLVYSYVLGLLTDSTFIENIANAVRGSGLTGNGQSSQTSTQDLTEITTRLTNAESRLGTLESANHWPTSYIGIKDTSTNEIIYYSIVTGPGQSGLNKGALVIEQSNVSLPNFYATLAVAIPTTSGTNATTTATVTVYNRHSGLNLTGGTIGNVVISGSLITANGGTYTLSTSVDKSSTTISAGSIEEDSESISIPLSALINAGDTINRIEITCTISGKAITGSATYLNSGAGVTTACDGYITLSNGS